MKTLIMTFLNESGSKVSISVTKPKDTLTGAEISAAMDTIILKGIFFSTGGNLVSKYSAQIVDKNTTDIAV